MPWAAANPLHPDYLMDSWQATDGLPLNRISNLLIGSDGYLWMGTLGGLLRFDGQRFTVFDTSGHPELGSDRFISLMEDTHGYLWAVTERYELVGFDGRQFRVWRDAVDATPLQVTHPPMQSGSRLWIGTANGPAWFDMSRQGWIRAASTPPVWKLLKDREDTLWVGTDQGLFHISTPAITSAATFMPAFGDGPILAMAQSTAGDLWVSNAEQVLRQHGGGVETITALDGVFRIDAEHEDGILLIRNAQDHLWHEGRMQTRLWPDQKEIRRLAPLTQHLGGAIWRAHRGTLARVLTEHDGLPNRELNGGVQRAGIVLSDGRLAFPTQSGVALVHPERVRDAVTLAPTRVKIESVELSDGHQIPAQPDGMHALPLGERNLSVRFTSLAANLTEMTHFRYRPGSDGPWIELGDQRQLQLLDMPPGLQHIQLAALDSRGETSAPVELAVWVPYWPHETPWFRIGLPLLALLALGHYIRRLKLRSAQRQQALGKAVEERTAELHTALQTVSRQHEEIASLAASKTSFFANVSHELRTPLALLLGPIQDMAQGHPPAPEITRIMQRNAHRLDRLIGQLLDLERLDAGRFPFTPQRLDLAALVHEAVAAFAPLAAQAGLELSADMPDAPAPVIGDAEQMLRVLGNLLSNAVKYCPSGQQIHLSLDQTSERVMLRVHDSGPGIPPEWRERIFDRFAQMASETSGSRKGTGLGLALCREVTDLHGGHLYATDSPLGGAGFVLELPTPEHSPLHPEQMATPAPSLMPAHATPWLPTSLQNTPENPATPSHNSTEADTRPRVLVAEDSPDLRQYLADCLGTPYQLDLAEDGQAALERALQCAPDLIVTDLMMPRMDGLQLAQAIRQQDELAGVPIIFLTARVSDADRIAGFTGGADHYLTKPFDRGVLLAQLAAALRGCHRLRDHFVARLATTPPSPSTSSSHSTETPSAFAEHLNLLFQAQAHDPGLDLARMAASLHMSEATLRRRCQAELSARPGELLRRHRLQQARELIGQRAGTLSEIAYAVGYGSLSAFGRAYREHFGQAPTRHLPE